MTQQSNEQVQALTVQALWVTQAISVLMGIGMVAFFVAEVLRGGSKVFKELKK